MTTALRRVFASVLGRDPRRLWLRYIVALTLIVALLLGAHVISKATVDAGRHDAEIVNVSGRQRTLGQRILHLADRWAERREPEIAARLAASIRLFETAHVHLTSLRDLPPEAQHVYFGAPGLDRRARAYVDLARTVLMSPPGPEQREALAQLEAEGLDALLATLNDAVTTFELAAKRNSADIALIQDAALYLALVILALEALVIFRPAQRLVTRTLDDLERRNAELAQARHEAQSRSAQLAAAAETLAHNAHHDALTGLANRARLEAELTRRLAESRRRREADHLICVMHVDLDRFKEVNDTLGHAAGDAVLRHVASALTENARTGDLVARVGGDEFVLVLGLPRAAAEHAARGIAEALIEAVRLPVLHDGAEARVGASVGYAFAEDADASPDRLIADADIALYEVKRSGRGAARAFGPRMRAGLERRRTAMAELEDALDRGAFEAFFQPVVAFDDGRLLGVEALARRRRPEGVDGPDVFFSLADEAGAVDRIDRLVAAHALDTLVALRAEGAAIPGLSLNISARTLQADACVEQLLDEILARGLAPEEISVEVLESILIEPASGRAARAIAELSRAGLRVLIDNFGAGHASLAGIASLEISGLKIDRSLVGDLADAKARHVVAAVTGLAKGLDLSVTAEGVETAEQFATLKRLGCDAAQGYAIGRPMDAAALRRWLSDYGAAPGSLQA
ncbi:MAG: EAL domain-containing protein [Pseudomonadota bacterium]